MSLRPPEKVRKLQRTLHAKAKESPDYRFYAVYDKVYREDVLHWAYRCCKANGGAAGVDGETFEDNGVIWTRTVVRRTVGSREKQIVSSSPDPPGLHPQWGRQAASAGHPDDVPVIFGERIGLHRLAGPGAGFI